MISSSQYSQAQYQYTTETAVPVISVAKTINQLLNIPSNRCCADCRSALVDSSQVHASFSPRRRVRVKTSVHNGLTRSFAQTHAAFAPDFVMDNKTASNENCHKPERRASQGHASHSPSVRNNDQEMSKSENLDRHSGHQTTATASTEAMTTATSVTLNGQESLTNFSTGSYSSSENGRPWGGNSINPQQTQQQQQHQNGMTNGSHQSTGNHGGLKSNSLRMNIDPRRHEKSYRHRNKNSDNGSKPLSVSPAKLADPAELAALYVWGHGVFLCAKCASAHGLLGEDVTIVRHVQEFSKWTAEEALLLKQGGGNTMGWKIYEAFLPESWRRRRPNHASKTADRLSFCRAKYDALAFVLPPTGGGPWSDQAWNILLEKSIWAKHHKSLVGDLRNLYALSLNTVQQRPSSLENSVTDTSNGGMMGGLNNNLYQPQTFSMPSRLVDYFCVVGSSGFLDPRILQKESLDLSTLGGPEDVMLEPRVMDCYPPPKEHTDMEFPEHVATFVLPEGCCPSDTQRSPFFFTFVLTAASGHRLYGASLRLYDEAIETQELRDIMEKSGYTGEFPPWLPQDSNTKSGDRSVDSTGTGGASSDYMDIVYLPKCLVVISHYPFFDLFRNYLLQLYRITLVEAPLPIERFISNFCCEVPLPPQGKVEVKFGFTVKDIWSIQRPPENKLPLANFSYKPIFACLSAGNIMTIVAVLMAEQRVALCSRHYALLTPVAEALLSFLFPLQWQGMYISVMPYSMLDILDAPVPFLVGLHARYLNEYPPHMRPHGVVFVDIDRDIVHLGFDEDTNNPRNVPALPEKGALKLRAKLEEFGTDLYLAPDNEKHEGSTITHGDGTEIPDAKREAYARSYDPTVSTFGSAAEGMRGVNHFETNRQSPRESRRQKERRRTVLRTVDKAYQENELLTPITGFLSEQGQLYNREKSMPQVRQLAARKSGNLKSIFKIRRLRSQQSFPEDDSTNGGNEGNTRDGYSRQGRHGILLDLEEPPGFDSEEIRNAFLRFFVSLLKSYEQFLNVNNAYQLFRVEDFLADLNLNIQSNEFVKTAVKTQMFQRFLEERQINPCDPLFLFFDECIIAKQNRSKRLTVRQRDTPFLDDPSGAIKETFTPPPPSNWGLPDDGRTYQYGCFPKLNYQLFGKTRPPMRWPRARQQNSLRDVTRPTTTSSTVKAWQNEILARSLAPVVSTPGAAYWVAKKGRVKNLESAIGALSYSKFETNSEPTEDFKKDFRSMERPLFGRRISNEGKGGGRGRSHSPVPPDKALRRTDFVKDFSSSHLNSAEQMLLNARRTKGIILMVIVQLQSVGRMYLVRRKYLRFLKGLTFLQYKWKRHLPEGLMEMDELDRARSSIFKIQRVARLYIVRRDYRAKLSAILLQQRCMRGALVRKHITQLERACRRIQTIVRSRRARFGLQLLRNLVSKFQALSRGYLTRKRITSLKERRMSRYREQIVLLWNRIHTPLSYRTKFWPMISDQCGFLRLRIAESELERLWIFLEVDFNRDSFNQNSTEKDHAEELRLGKLLGINDYTYWRYLKVKQMTSSVLLFPAEERRNSELRIAGDRVEAERIQIYERISVNKPQIAAMLWTLYGLFKIDKKDKHKKFRLAELVCKFATSVVLSCSASVLPPAMYS